MAFSLTTRVSGWLTKVNAYGLLSSYELLLRRCSVIALNLYLLAIDHGFYAGHDKRTYWLIILTPRRNGP